MSKLKGDHLFSTYAKFSEKLTFLTSLLRTCKWAYQVVRNLFFPRKFCVRTKWIPQVAFWILKQNVIRERVLKVVYTFLAGFDNYHKSSLKLLLFFSYWHPKFSRCSSELAQLVPVPFSRGRSTRYSDCMIFLSPFLDVTKMSMSAVSSSHS